MSLILVVDDEPAIRRSLRKMLEREGHSVMECGNGLEALGLLERTSPDILITDVQMPHIDGYELAAMVRGRPRTSRVRRPRSRSRRSTRRASSTSRRRGRW